MGLLTTAATTGGQKRGCKVWRLRDGWCPVGGWTKAVRPEPAGVLRGERGRALGPLRAFCYGVCELRVLPVGTDDLHLHLRARCTRPSSGGCLGGWGRGSEPEDCIGPVQVIHGGRGAGQVIKRNPDGPQRTGSDLKPAWDLKYRWNARGILEGDAHRRSRARGSVLNHPPPSPGGITIAVHLRRRGGTPPGTPLPLPDQSGHRGTNEIYNRESLIGPFLVH